MFSWRISLMAVPCALLAIAAAGTIYSQSRASSSRTKGGSPASLIVKDANIYTVNPKMPHAQAMAIRGDKIAYVGTNEGALTFKGPQAQVVDLGGKTVVPGFIDAHGHFISLGESLRHLSFVDTRSYAEIISMVRQKAGQTPKGEWILGRGWDQTRWPDKSFPDHHALSAVTPNNPVWLTRVDGHAGLANAEAMRLAEITRDTPDPSGGRILHDPETGEPTGVFIDNAQSLIERRIPPLTRDQIKRAALLAIHKCLADGLTEVGDAGVGMETIEAYKELIDEGKFDFRIYAMIMATGVPADPTGKNPATAALEAYLKGGPKLLGYGHNRLTVRSIKIIADGALGSRGAAMLEPYSDDPGNRGLMVTPPDAIYFWAKRATDGGFQVNTHAIGDRANRIWLDTVARLEKENPKVAALRLRDEHAQILSLSDIPRFAKLRVIPSMQPTHCTSDMRWAEQRVGPQRIKGAYAWQTLYKTGVRIAEGSDFPVEDPNPLWGFYSAITRQDHDGNPPGGWRPQDRMTRQQALRGFTLDAAYAAFQEKIKGSLEVGKLADFVVLSQDIMKIEPRYVLVTEVEKTYLGGKMVYGKTP